MKEFQRPSSLLLWHDLEWFVQAVLTTFLANRQMRSSWLTLLAQAVMLPGRIWVAWHVALVLAKNLEELLRINQLAKAVDHWKIVMWTKIQTDTHWIGLFFERSLWARQLLLRFCNPRSRYQGRLLWTFFVWCLCNLSLWRTKQRFLSCFHTMATKEI